MPPIIATAIGPKKSLRTSGMSPSTAADAVSTILRNTIRQLQTPDGMRGRMTSINQIFFAGGPQLGEIEAGLVAEALGVPFAIFSGGIGCLLAAGFIAMRWPQLRGYNGDEATAL